MGRIGAGSAAVFLWLSAGALRAQVPQDPGGVTLSGPLAQSIDEYLTRCVPFGFSGSVLVAMGGAVVLAKGYGVADRETGSPCSPTTIFDVGDLTKQFTATAVLVLEQQKKLKTKDTLEKFLPDVPDDKRKLQLQHLLTHTSGLPHSLKDVGPKLEERDELVRTVLRLPLRDTPGSDFLYSHLGYDLLAAIVEIVTKQPFEQALEGLLFQPAGLKNTGFRLDGKLTASQAARGLIRSDPPPAGSLSTGALMTMGDPKERDLSAENELATEGWYSWGLRGAGGVLSTVEDLWRWEQALRGEALLTKDSKKKLFTPALDDHACGWIIRHGERKAIWMEHGGTTTSGFEAQCARFPDENAYAVLLANAPGVLFPVKVGVHRLLFEREVELPPPAGALAPEALSAFTGEYGHENGARWRVSTLGAGLLLEARTPEAFALLSGKLSGDQKHILKQSEELVAGLGKADFTALRALDEYERLRWVEGWWRELLAHHGTLRGATLLGLAQAAEVLNHVVVLLEFERGEELLTLRWGDEYLFGLDIDPPYASRLRLVPDSERGFVWFDLARGQRTAAARFGENGELEFEHSGVKSRLGRR